MRQQSIVTIRSNKRIAISAPYIDSGLFRKDPLTPVFQCVISIFFGPCIFFCLVFLAGKVYFDFPFDIKAPFFETLPNAAQWHINTFHSEMFLHTPWTIWSICTKLFSNIRFCRLASFASSSTFQYFDDTQVLLSISRKSTQWYSWIQLLDGRKRSIIKQQRLNEIFNIGS